MGEPEPFDVLRVMQTTSIQNPASARQGILARRAFSLIELIVVVVILGVIATIAIPRMSRGAVGAAESALKADLAVMRNAIELYKAEHDGAVPTLANMPGALTQYTNSSGAVSATAATTHPYGPYLAAVPAIKLGANKGSTVIDESTNGAAAWHYDASTGEIVANASGSDSSGVNYADY